MVSTFDYIIKKYNIEVGRQYVIDLPIVGAVGLVDLFAELGFKVGAEIGTDEGILAEYMFQSIPNLNLVCIDPWKAEAYEKGQQPESFVGQDYFDKRYETTLERLKNKDVQIKRMTSMEAVSLATYEGGLEDNSLDFVYIDGNHDFLNVAQDIHYWKKKVRPGGIVSGHDYVRYPSRKFNHVQKVVNAYTQAYHHLPVFLVTPTDKGMKRDRFRSWFFVKQ